MLHFLSLRPRRPTMFWSKWSASRQAQCCVTDSLHYRVKVVEHLVVRKPEELDSQGFDESLSFLIGGLRSFLEMAVSIYLDCQPERRAVEVNDERPNAELPPEPAACLASL